MFLLRECDEKYFNFNIRTILSQGREMQAILAKMAWASSQMPGGKLSQARFSWAGKRLGYIR